MAVDPAGKFVTNLVEDRINKLVSNIVNQEIHSVKQIPSSMSFLVSGDGLARKLRYFFGALFFYALCISPLNASGVSVSPVIVDQTASSQLLEQLDAIRALNARFNQTVRDNKGVLVDESSGRFLWKRPDLFRWDIEQPFPQSIVLNGKEQLQYDADLEQLTIQPILEEAVTLPNILLAGDVASLDQLYSVRIIKSVIGSDDNSSVVEGAVKQGKEDAKKLLFLLSPKGQSAELQSILMEFSGGALAAIDVVDSLQQTSRFELENIQGPALAEEDFEIQTAPGTSVIYP